MSMLRESTTEEVNYKLFKVQPAYLLERNTNTDTPLPPDEPLAKNPPDGAMIDYHLMNGVTKVTIEIIDSNGKVIRKFASDDPIAEVDPKAITVMPGWVRPKRNPGMTPGFHRFIWDLRHLPTGTGRGGLPISAVWGETPYGPQGAMVEPGLYKVKLTLENPSFEVSKPSMEDEFEVRADPRKS